MLGRRQFLAGLGGVAVIGFNPTSRTWVATAQAFSSPFDHVPPLDGVIVMDPASLAADAVDVGNIIHNTPVAILRPGSVEDVQKMIRFCRRFNIKVAGRGQAHTTFGQSQVLGGLIIETGTLNTVHSITSTTANVDGGVLWKNLLQTIVPQGLTPPALTGFTGLSFGGTLSVGGISANFGNGAQVDFVRELDVVTGEGDLKTCSETQNSELFEVALAGLGQCGIITRAVVDLIPALPLVRVMLFPYPEDTTNATFFKDFRTLINRGELDECFNLGIPKSSGGWGYGLNTAKYFDPSNPPDVAQLFRGLSFDPSSVQVIDVPYLPYLLRIDALVAQFIQAGLWNNVLHPWFDIFLPDSTVEQYVGDVYPTLTFEDVGAQGFLLLFAKKRSNFRRPLLRVPNTNDDWFFLFDILTAAAQAGPMPDFQARMIARNNQLFRKARLAGGTRYPIGVIQFNQLDWILHYGEEWPEFAARKRQFDPDNILTPGPGIFQGGIFQG